MDSRRLKAAKRLTPALLFLAALLPRLAAMGRYVTPDEPIWVYRSLGFREALLSADWANTIQSGHPGVTTTWLGAIGIQLQLWLQPASRSHLDWINKLYWLAPDNGPAIQHLATFLPAARLMVILVTSLGLVAIFLLARDRLGFTPALLATLLLALDPFVAGLSGLLHVDALLATFMLITLLLILPKRDDRQQWDDENRFPVRGACFVLAGLTTALAILSKTPGLLLVLFVPAIVLWLSIQSRSASGGLKALLIWGATLLVALAIFLPAIWADPGHVIDVTSGLAERLIDTAVRPTFFLGQVTLEPGNAFYPLAIAFRLSPPVSLVLLGLLGWLLYGLATRRPVRMPANAAWLLGLSLSFILFLNLAAKRFDRYALPAIMPLILIAGWGIAVAAKKTTLVAKRRFWLELMIGIMLFQLIYAFLYWPYPLTAYNWLLGGPGVAQRVLPIGWGEGTGAGAQWAAELPGSENRVLFAGSVPAAAPFFGDLSMSLDEQNLSRLEEDDVLLFVARDWQLEPEAYEVDPTSETPLPKALEDFPVAHTIYFNGLPRAALYTGLNGSDLGLEPLTAQPLGYNFDQAVRIVSAGARSAAWPETLPVVIDWQANQPAEYQLRLELLDSNDYAWVSYEQPLLNEVDQAALHWPPGETQRVDYSLPVPPDLPPGPYLLAASLFDTQGKRLGVFDSDGRFQGTAASLAELALLPPAEQPMLELPVAVPSGHELTGHGLIPQSVGSGQRLTVDLWWRPETAATLSGQLALMIGPESIPATLALPDGRPGQTYHIRPSWPIPMGLPAGTYPLAVQLLDDGGRPRWPEPIGIGQIEVVAIDRDFELPDGISPLGIQLAPVAKLQQAQVEIQGEDIVVFLTWQADMPDGRAYTVFVHLSDEEGNNVDQIDRPPSEPTDRWVPGQVVFENFRLPAPAAGRYTIAVGLYDAASGLRLPMYAADGSSLPGDQYLLNMTVP